MACACYSVIILYCKEHVLWPLCYLGRINYISVTLRLENTLNKEFVAAENLVCSMTTIPTVLVLYYSTEKPKNNHAGLNVNIVL